MKQRRAKLERQSFEIASKLEEGGVPAFDNKSDLSVVSLITGQRKRVEGYRNITFIPVIAKKRRSKTLKRLEYFVSQPEQEGKVRMWVFNTGHKVPLGECRERIQQLHRNLGLLAGELRERFGVDMFFRSTELANLERKSGLPHFNVHSHVLVRTPYLRDWSRMLAWVNEKWRTLNNLSPNLKWHPFQDAESLYQIREACKYVVKPNELEDLNSEETVQLFGDLHGLHLVQPMGRFKQLCRNLTDNHLKPVFRKNRVSGQLEWRLTPSWNRRTDRDLEKERMFRLNNQLAEELAWNWKKPHEVIKDLRAEPDQLECSSNRILAFLEPSCVFNDAIEPCAIVLNWTAEFMADHSAGGGWVNRIQEAFEVGVGSQDPVGSAFLHPLKKLYRVHNRSITSEQPKEDSRVAELAIPDPPF